MMISFVNSIKIIIFNLLLLRGSSYKDLNQSKLTNETSNLSKVSVYIIFLFLFFRFRIYHEAVTKPLPPTPRVEGGVTWSLTKNSLAFTRSRVAPDQGIGGADNKNNFITKVAVKWPQEFRREFKQDTRTQPKSSEFSGLVYICPTVHTYSNLNLLAYQVISQKTTEYNSKLKLSIYKYIHGSVMYSFQNSSNRYVLHIPPNIGVSFRRIKANIRLSMTLSCPYQGSWRNSRQWAFFGSNTSLLVMWWSGKVFHRRHA